MFNLKQGTKFNVTYFAKKYGKFITRAGVWTEKSKKYWTSFNKVPLDNQFEWTLESSAEFTTQGLDLVNSYNQSAYLMPITVSAQEYLEKITPKKSI